MLNNLREQSEGGSESEEDLDEQTNNLLGIFRVRKRVEIEKYTTEAQFQRLKQDLSCPICLELFNIPAYNKDCSHRFCKGCIEKTIRLQKEKQCPTCRKKIATRRDFRVDDTLQKVLDTVFQDVSQQRDNEQKQNEQFYEKFIKQQNNQQVVKILNDGEAKSCTFQLFAYNQLVRQIEKNYIRAPLSLTLEEIIELVQIKLNLTQEYKEYIDIYINDELQTAMKKTLDAINTEYWDIKSDFQPYQPNEFYKWSQNESNIVSRPIYYSLDRYFKQILFEI